MDLARSTLVFALTSALGVTVACSSASNGAATQDDAGGAATSSGSTSSSSGATSSGSSSSGSSGATSSSSGSSGSTDDGGTGAAGSCDPTAWIQMTTNADACEGHLGESCGWTTTNEGQGYHCQTVSWGTGCEAGGTTCPGGTSSSSGGSSSSGSSSGSSSSSSGSSGGTSSGALPAHVLTGYWQDFDNGAQTVSLAGVPTTYGLVAVAFANADASNPGGVTFSIDSGLASALGGYTAAQFTSDITTLHGRGQKVIISVGGQNGAISVTDATSATNFANSVYGLMTQYGFDGVDIDLENGVTPASMASALQQLSAKAGSGLIITLAPQTIDMQSTSGDYFQLALSIKSILTIVNMQFYNSGTMDGADGNVYAEGNVNFLTALAAIQLEGGLRPDQVGIGVPSSTSAAGSGYVAPSVVNAALDCLASGTNCGTFVPSAKYPTIRGAMTWSINWDGSNGYSFASGVATHLATLP